MTPAERATQRIKDEMVARNLSQVDLAEALQCSPGKITKILNNRVDLHLNDLAAMADACGIPLTEAIRDRGLEFYAEMTPTEVRIVERLRRHPGTSHALLTLMQITDRRPDKKMLRQMTPTPRAPKGRPRTKVASDDPR